MKQFEVHSRLTQCGVKVKAGGNGDKAVRPAVF